MLPERLKATFINDVSSEFLSDLIALLKGVYPEAHRQIYSQYDFPEAHDALGVNRRAMIEGSLRELSQRYPHMNATVRQNRKRTQNYTEVRSGRVILTTSCLHYPQSPLRLADFRTRLVRRLQYSIKEIQEDSVVEGGAVFAVIAHGPQAGERLRLDWKELGFAFAGFPTIDGQSWEAQIDLMKAYGHSSSAEDAETENIEDRISPTIRRKRDQERPETGG